MRLDLSSNINEVLGWTARLHPQFQFACAVALTRTIQDAQRDVIDEEKAEFDKPTPYALKATFIRAAKKTNLSAELVIKDRAMAKTGQSHMDTIGHEFTGGTRRRKQIEGYATAAGLLGAREYLVPAAYARLDSYGNMSRGQVAQIMSQLRLGLDPYSWKSKSARSKRNQKRAGIMFWSRGEHLKRGIWMRDGSDVVPIMLAVSSVTYKKRVDVIAISERATLLNFDRHLAREFALAVATAK